MHINIYLYVPHARSCRKFITNVPHVHNIIASYTMVTVYFETFKSLQLTNIVIIAKFFELCKFSSCSLLILQLLEHKS